MIKALYTKVIKDGKDGSYKGRRFKGTFNPKKAPGLFNRGLHQVKIDLNVPTDSTNNKQIISDPSIEIISKP